jgi:hypothetical protein
MAVDVPFEVSTSPAVGAAATNNHDSNQLTNGTCRSLYVGVTGDIKVTMANGDVVTFTNVGVGLLAVSCKQVWSTGTTATGLVALY